MKRLILVLTLFLSTQAMGQTGQMIIPDSLWRNYNPEEWKYYAPIYEPVITDSIVWKTVDIDSLNLGKNDCDHIWIYSKVRHDNMNISCGVYHAGFHCDWDDGIRDRICSQCLRKETQSEFWYQHRKEHIETEYEKLEKKLKKKN